jgi:hypothetical protein
MDAVAPASNAAPVETANEWSIPASMDTSVSRGDSDFKERTILLLRAGKDAPLDEASKIYLRFPLVGVDRKRLDLATLQLTAGKKGSVKVKNNPYKMQVWALKSTEKPVWDDALTWENAPGNHLESAGGMLEDKSVLLTTFDLPANPETGDRFLIDAKPLVDFIRDLAIDELTLVLTGDAETDHKGGWRITSLEDAGRFPPPTLLLKTK